MNGSKDGMNGSKAQSGAAGAAGAGVGAGAGAGEAGRGRGQGAGRGARSARKAREGNAAGGACGGAGGARRAKAAVETWTALKQRTEGGSVPSQGVAARYFNTVSDERSYIKAHLTGLRDLQSVVNAGVLEPVSTVHLPAHSQAHLVVVFKVPNNVMDGASAQANSKLTLSAVAPGGAGKVRSLESYINIEILQYSRELIEGALFHRGHRVDYAGADALLDSVPRIPTRCLPINAKVCRSVMEVAQRHINFGTVLANDDCTKKLIIKNRSDVPLMYQVSSVCRAYLLICAQ